MTTHPIAPRLTTSVALVSARIAFSASIGSVLPPAIANSSPVPITRSNFGRMRCRCAVTVSERM
jgi:hypothetical protein